MRYESFQDVALDEMRDRRREFASERLRKAVEYKRKNEDISFGVVGQLFHISAARIKEAMGR